MAIRTRYTLAAAFLVVALAACGQDDKNDSGGTQDSGAESSFSPQEGPWVLTAQSFLVNTCFQVADDEPLDQTPFQLTSNGDGTFSVQPGDSEAEPMVCTLVDHDFECLDVTFFLLDYSEFEMDALFTAHGDVTGSFSSETQMEARQTYEITCEGEDCQAIAEKKFENLPCQIDLEIQAEAT